MAANFRFRKRRLIRLSSDRHSESAKSPPPVPPPLDGTSLPGMYEDDQWTEITRDRPLSGLSDRDLLLIHRHWLWANQQREWFFKLLRNPDLGDELPEALFARRSTGAMFVWYGLLWTVIEGFEDRKIVLRDPLLSDVMSLGDSLRRCRNAVLHIPRADDYVDQRIHALLENDESVPLIRTVHSSYGRLLIEEMQQRYEDR